jgi:hypothetical protein
MCCWVFPTQSFSGPSPLVLAIIFYCHRFETPLFVASYDSHVHTSESESESYVTTDGQSASLSWYKAPIRGLRPDFYCRTDYGIRLIVTFLIPWGALSDERMGLSFLSAAGPCQRSLSRVLVPWDLRPYFTVSDLRRPFSSPPTTRMVTVEVFDPASTPCTDRIENNNDPNVVFLPLLCLETASSIVACVFISTGTCLPSHCIAMNYSGFQASCRNT